MSRKTSCNHKGDETSLPQLQHTATHCNTLQHTATRRNTLQQTGRTRYARVRKCKKEGGQDQSLQLVSSASSSSLQYHPLPHTFSPKDQNIRSQPNTKHTHTHAQTYTHVHTHTNTHTHTHRHSNRHLDDERIILKFRAGKGSPPLSPHTSALQLYTRACTSSPPTPIPSDNPHGSCTPRVCGPLPATLISTPPHPSPPLSRFPVAGPPLDAVGRGDRVVAPPIPPPRNPPPPRAPHEPHSTSVKSEIGRDQRSRCNAYGPREEEEESGEEEKEGGKGQCASGRGECRSGDSVYMPRQIVYCKSND